jgi:hypothetical protein
MDLQLLHITVKDELPAPVDAQAYAADPLHVRGTAGHSAGDAVRVVLFCSDTSGRTVAVHVTGWEPRALIKLRARRDGEPWTSEQLASLAGSLQAAGQRTGRTGELVTGKRLPQTTG